MCRSLLKHFYLLFVLLCHSPGLKKGAQKYLHAASWGTERGQLAMEIRWVTSSEMEKRQQSTLDRQDFSGCKKRKGQSARQITALPAQSAKWQHSVSSCSSAASSFKRWSGSGRGANHSKGWGEGQRGDLGPELLLTAQARHRGEPLEIKGNHRASWTRVKIALASAGVGVWKVCLNKE